MNLYIFVCEREKIMETDIISEVWASLNGKDIKNFQSFEKEMLAFC